MDFIPLLVFGVLLLICLVGVHIDRRQADPPYQRHENKSDFFKFNFVELYFIWPLADGLPEYDDDAPSMTTPWEQTYFGETKFANSELILNWLYDYAHRFDDYAAYSTDDAATKLEARGHRCLCPWYWMRISDLEEAGRFSDDPNDWYTPEDYIAAAEDIAHLVKADDPLVTPLLQPFTDGSLRTRGLGDPKEACLALAEEIAHRARICKERGLDVIGLCSNE